MLRPLLLTMAFFFASIGDANAGVIGVGGSTSDLAPEELAVQLLYAPEVKVDRATYGRITERLSRQSRVKAVYRGEILELLKLRVNGRDNIVESQLRMKLIQQ